MIQAIFFRKCPNYYFSKVVPQIYDFFQIFSYGRLFQNIYLSDPSGADLTLAFAFSSSSVVLLLLSLP